MKKRAPRKRVADRCGWRKCQLALFDPCDDSEPIEFVAQVFTNCPKDRAAILRTIERFNKMANEEGFRHCLAPFPVE